MRDQLPSNIFQSRLAENFHGAVVGFQGVIKRDFIVCQAKLVTALVSLAHLLGEFDQFRNDLCGFDGAVLVTADGGFQHFGEGAGLDEVFP